MLLRRGNRAERHSNPLLNQPVELSAAFLGPLLFAVPTANYPQFKVRPCLTGVRVPVRCAILAFRLLIGLGMARLYGLGCPGLSARDHTLPATRVTLRTRVLGFNL
jgi:hypothetical protein